MNVLEAAGLHYQAAGKTIIAGVNLTLDQGERVAVTGPPGSGKSTLLALLAGLLTPDSGKVFLHGQPLTGPARPTQGVALVLQGYGLVSLLTAAENIEIALRASGVSGIDAVHAARTALSDVDLGDHLHHLVEELPPTVFVAARRFKKI